jgi:hypothetical protein
MYIMAGLLVIGFLANVLVLPLDERHYAKNLQEAEATP